MKKLLLSLGLSALFFMGSIRCGDITEVFYLKTQQEAESWFKTFYKEKTQEAFYSYNIGQAPNYYGAWRMAVPLAAKALKVLKVKFPQIPMLELWKEATGYIKEHAQGKYRKEIKKILAETEKIKLPELHWLDGSPYNFVIRW